MTLNDVIAVILRYLIEFCSFGGQLRHSGWSYTHIVCDKDYRPKNRVFGSKWFTVIFSEITVI